MSSLPSPVAASGAPATPRRPCMQLRSKELQDAILVQDVHTLVPFDGHAYTMYPGDWIHSMDGQWCFTLQEDGNVCKYKNLSGGKREFKKDSGTFQKNKEDAKNYRLVFQDDKNLVLYDGVDRSAVSKYIVWSQQLSQDSVAFMVDDKYLDAGIDRDNVVSFPHPPLRKR